MSNSLLGSFIDVILTNITVHRSPFILSEFQFPNIHRYKTKKRKDLE